MITEAEKEIKGLVEIELNSGRKGEQDLRQQVRTHIYIHSLQAGIR